MTNKYKVYADNAATTEISPEVFGTMMECLEHYGNPSSLHSVGIRAKGLISGARRQVATAIGARDCEIYFTSGGSESNNWAVKGFAYANSDKGRHLITSAIEHPSVLNTMKYLEKNGFEVDYIGVNQDGIIDIEQLKAAIRSDTILISVMFANNEIGTVEPIKEIGEIAKQHNICFHTDAVQALGKIQIDVNDLNIDMLSLSGHKLHAPKGIGALYIKKGIKLDSLIHGGHQEHGLRAGTENVTAIVCLGRAIDVIQKEQAVSVMKISKMRDYFVEQLEDKIPNIRINGSRTHRLPGIVNVSFQGIEGEGLLLILDSAGICASSGSACSSISLNPSHVLAAIGLDDELAHGSIRFSLSKYNSMEDINYIMSVLSRNVERLRSMRIV